MAPKKREPAPDLLGAVEAAIGGASNDDLLEAHTRLCEALAERCESLADLLLAMEEAPPIDTLQAALAFTGAAERQMPWQTGLWRDERLGGLWLRAKHAYDEILEELATPRDAVDA